MKKVNLKMLEKGTVKIEIQSFIPEKFINLLWKNGIFIRNISKLNITTMQMEIRLRDYIHIERIARQTETRVKVVSRTGISFLILKMRKQITLTGGIVIFLILLYYLSTFIWNIEIVTGVNISPYEIRQTLITYGIKPGISKSKINVYLLEDKIKRDIDEILWSRIRIEGAKLIVTIIESVTPPNMVSEDTPCDIISKIDGQITRVFTSSGTAIVKPGEMVKAGQLLVKGQQGKEGNTYAVHSKGEVIAKTFYENVREIPIRGVKYERSGVKTQNLFVYFMGKKIYIKKTLNKFESCDKIEDNKSFIKSETYFETIKKEFVLNAETVLKQTVEDMTSKTLENMDKSVKLLEKKVDSELVQDSLRIRILFIIEQEIGVQRASQ